MQHDIGYWTQYIFEGKTSARLVKDSHSGRAMAVFRELLWERRPRDIGSVLYIEFILPAN